MPGENRGDSCRYRRHSMFVVEYRNWQSRQVTISIHSYRQFIYGAFTTSVN